MINNKKTILVISLFDNVFNVQWECINTVIHKYNFEFILLFRDKKIEKVLKDNQIRFHIADYKFFSTCVKYLPFIRVFLKEVYYYFSYIRISFKIKEKHDFLFINDNSSTVGKYFLRDFNAKGKPSFLYEYGLSLFDIHFIDKISTKRDRGLVRNFLDKYEEKIIYNSLYKKIFRLKSSGYIPLDFGAHYLLVLNEISKKNALSLNYSFKEVINVGNVQYEKYKDVVNKNGDYILLILSNGYEVVENYGYDKNDYFKNLKKLLLYLRENQKNVILKHHPNDRLHLYKDLKKEFSSFTWVNHNEKSNKDLIINSELVISPMSTLAMEVIFIKKPLLFFNYYNESNESFHFYNKVFKKLPVIDVNINYSSNLNYISSDNINDKEYDNFIKSESFKNNFTNFLSRLESI